MLSCLFVSQQFLRIAVNESKNMQIIKACGKVIVFALICCLFSYISEGYVWQKAVCSGVPFGIATAFFLGTYKKNGWSWIGCAAIYLLGRLGLQHLLGM